MLDAVQRRAIRLIGDPALTCRLQPLSHGRTVNDFLLLYRYSNGFCSSKLTSRRAIRLIRDPALTCHLQPLSHGPGMLSVTSRCSTVFRLLKMGWKKAVRKFNKQKPGQTVNKISFAPQMQSTIRMTKKGYHVLPSNGSLVICAVCPKV
nr:unnamed protein product [Callosobruchus chinensis]